MRPLILIVMAGAPTYFGYYVFANAVDRAWAYYVAQALLVLALADCVRRWVPDHVGASLVSLATALCWWIEIEAAQQAVCGALQWGHPVHADLCVQVVGRGFYQAVAALSLAGLATWLLSRRR